MKNDEYKRIIDVDQKFNELATELNVVYKSEWDDAVHDSFLGYVKCVSCFSEEIHKIRSTGEEIIQEIEELKIDDIQKKVKSLQNEVNLL